MKFTVILTPDEEDGGYVAECPSIPGCVSQGETIEEAMENIRESIEGCVESIIEHGRSLPNDGTVLVGNVEVPIPALVKA